MKIIAFSILSIGACSAYGAGSSVRMYGTVDSGIYYQSTSAKSFNPSAPDAGSAHGLKDGGLSSSIIGFAGQEDLGGGNSLKFKLQGAFNTKTGNGGITDVAGASSLLNQVTSVTLSSGYGDVEIGRQIAPMAFALFHTDVRSASNFGSIRTAWNSLNYRANFPGTHTRKYIGGLFESNAVVYTSPKFHGFYVMGEYTFGEAGNSSKNGSRRSAVLHYANAGLHVAASYYAGYDTALAAGAAPTGKMDNRYVYLGAKYTTGPVSVSASVSNGKNPSRPNDVNLDLYSLGLGYRFTPFLQLTSSIFYTRDKNNDANRATLVSAGLEYSLSKRTLLYGQVGHVQNKGSMNQEIAFAMPVAPGKNTTQTNLGMRHSF